MLVPNGFPLNVHDLKGMLLRRYYVVVLLPLTLWSSYTDPLPDSSSDALLHVSESIFPTIHSLLCLICTLSVTS